MGAPDYQSQVVLVENPALPYVLCCRSNTTISVSSLFSQMTWEQMLQLRASINENKKRETPFYRCPKCKTPVYLLSSINYRVFFQHLPTMTKCSLKEKSLTRKEINATIYATRTESPKHRELIYMIRKSLSYDDEFSSIQSPATVRSSAGDGTRRYPDILSDYADIKVVFEAQVSSTFLDIIQERRDFYANEKMCLMWIMEEFDPYNRRLTQDDMIVHHKGVAFVVNEETLMATMSASEFIVRGYIYDQTKGKWDTRLISFSDLLLEPDLAGVYFDDKKMLQMQLRVSLVDLSHELAGIDRQTVIQQQDKLASLIKKLGIKPELAFSLFGDMGLEDIKTTGISRNLQRMVRVIETAEKGEPFGFGFKTKSLIQIANSLYEHDPFALTVYGAVLKHNSHVNKLKSQDTNGNWKLKTQKIRFAWSTFKQKSLLNVFEQKVLSLAYPEYEKYFCASNS